MVSLRVSNELAFCQIFISFGFQREAKAGLEPPLQFLQVLKSKLHGKYKETSTPPGLAKGNAWGPILFQYCRVQYNKETKKLEIGKGEFVGKCKPTSHRSFVDNLKREHDAFNDDGDRRDGDNKYVDNTDGQLSVDVVADNILPGLCFLF